MATLVIPAAALITFCVVQILKLNLRPSGMSNRLTEYAWLVLYGVVGLFAVRLIWRGIYWMLVAAWPNDLGISVSESQIVVELGPMGRKVFDSKQVRVRYPYDDPESGDDGLVEALQDPQGYRAAFLPKLMHPATPDRLDQMIRHLTAADEVTLARRMLPFVMWRRSSDGLEEPDGAAADE